MEVIKTIKELRAALKGRHQNDRTIGLVPTMGFLHDGHASLIRRAAVENATVVLSIFVNPTQFGPNEDFERYPRNVEGDLRVAEEAGADFVFMPDIKEMYPREPMTSVSLVGVTERLCGASRPGHFDGVALVVCKLLNIVQPDRAYFGMKDAQQVAVIQTMVADLNQDTTIVVCPIVRAADGLALSSRNVYLSDDEREQALMLSQALHKSEDWLKETKGDPVKLRSYIQEYISASPLADIDYIEVLSYPALLAPLEWNPAEHADREWIVALAVRFGTTRLIDNRLIPMKV
ncbi:MAG: pantoate--beta-alanine ligase [Gorillibacterium sp.]|nr:pantoate--beta-alanine ligase [Gorillibacterium sp.]